MKQPLGLVLAGGQATRMGGGDKALLALGGQSLLAHVLDRLAPQVAKVAISANGRAARFADFGLPVLPDSISGFAGPLAGVLAGLDWAAGQGGDTLVSVATDTPFLPCDLVPRLIAAAEGMGTPLALAATADGWQPTFGLWPVALRDDLRAALLAGTRKMAGWVDQHGGRTARFASPGAGFFNINTPEDLVEARRILAAGAR